MLLVAASQVQGDENWSLPLGQSGDWSLAANWSGYAAPTTADNAFIINGGTVAITLPNAFCQNLYLGDPNSTNSGNLQMTGGNLSALNDEYVGNNGAGAFTQSGGANAIYGNDYISGAYAWQPLSRPERGFQRQLHPQRHGTALGIL